MHELLLMNAYTYDSLLQHWQQSGANANDWIKLDGFKLKRLPDGNFRLVWEEGPYGPYHTMVEVRSDGLYDCRRRKGWRRSSRCLQKTFGWNVEFAFDYPEVLGIKGRAYNLKRFLADSRGQPVYPLELYEFSYDGKIVTYEQLTAALALQVLHYCRLRQHPQLQFLSVRSRHTYLEFAPRRYRGLVGFIVNGLFRRVSLLSRLREGEGICWTFPDLAPIEAQLRELARDLGNPSTWHLPATPAGMSSVPDLSALDFSRFPKILPRQFGPGLRAQVHGEKVQIVHPSSGVLVAEVDRERRLTLWDTRSPFAREVHMLFNPKIERDAYVVGKICYARVRNVTIDGPVFEGCQVDSSGTCLYPIERWSFDCTPEELAWQLRQAVVRWMEDHVGVLVEEIQRVESLNVDGAVAVSAEEIESFWYHLPTDQPPFVEGRNSLDKHIRQWCKTHVQPFLRDYSLLLSFDFRVQSAHDLLMLQADKPNFLGGTAEASCKLLHSGRYLDPSFR